MLDLSTDLSTYEQEYKESMNWFGCSLNDFNNKGSLPTKLCLSLSQRGADLTPKQEHTTLTFKEASCTILLLNYVDNNVQLLYIKIFSYFPKNNNKNNN